MDSKSIAVNGLKGACRTFLLDLQALPEDAFDKCFGGTARTVADIVYEVNLVNDHVGMVIRGEKPFEWAEDKWIKAPENFRTKQVVIDAFDSSSQKILATVDGFSQEQIEEVFETEDGPKTRFERCRFMTLHLWYHSGQLNFIQSLLGDDEWHWK